MALARVSFPALSVHQSQHASPTSRRSTELQLEEIPNTVLTFVNKFRR
jgi:hypothetical protein